MDFSHVRGGADPNEKNDFYIIKKNRFFARFNRSILPDVGRAPNVFWPGRTVKRQTFRLLHPGLEHEQLL